MKKKLVKPVDLPKKGEKVLLFPFQSVHSAIESFRKFFLLDPVLHFQSSQSEHSAIESSYC